MLEDEPIDETTDWWDLLVSHEDSAWTLSVDSEAQLLSGTVPDRFESASHQESVSSFLVPSAADGRPGRTGTGPGYFLAPGRTSTGCVYLLDGSDSHSMTRQKTLANESANEKRKP